jgi:Protein of unknown function (DUF789)
MFQGTFLLLELKFNFYLVICISLSYPQTDEFCKKEEVWCCKNQYFNKSRKITDAKTSSTSLPPFGLATYKVKGSLWLNAERDKEIAASLYSAADSWLKQLGVQHHDFTYFTSHSV